jgi:hypothetical protein
MLCRTILAAKFFMGVTNHMNHIRRNASLPVADSKVTAPRFGIPPDGTNEYVLIIVESGAAGMTV